MDVRTRIKIAKKNRERAWIISTQHRKRWRATIDHTMKGYRTKKERQRETISYNIFAYYLRVPLLRLPCWRIHWSHLLQKVPGIKAHTLQEPLPDWPCLLGVYPTHWAWPFAEWWGFEWRFGIESCPSPRPVSTQGYRTLPVHLCIHSCWEKR